MNVYDEELQDGLENGLNPKGEDVDVRAYREVFRALAKDPDFVLPAGFSEAVVARVASRQKKKDARDYFWFAAGITFLLISFFLALLFTGFSFDFNFGFLNAMSNYRGLAVFGILFIAFLNWLDKKLLDESRFQHRI